MLFGNWQFWKPLNVAAGFCGQLGAASRQAAVLTLLFGFFCFGNLCLLSREIGLFFPLYVFSSHTTQTVGICWSKSVEWLYKLRWPGKGFCHGLQAKCFTSTARSYADLALLEMKPMAAWCLRSTHGVENVMASPQDKQETAQFTW